MLFTKLLIKNIINNISKSYILLSVNKKSESLKLQIQISAEKCWRIILIKFNWNNIRVELSVNFV